MKIYAVGGTPEELRKIAAFCQENQWPMSVTPHIGRPPGDYPVQAVLDAFEKYKTVRAAARGAGTSPGTAHRILKQAGRL